MLRPLTLAALLVAGCTPPPADIEPPPQNSVPPEAASAAPVTSSAPKADPPVACGALDCKLYATAREALTAIIAETKTNPVVLAFGEAHAQADTPSVASSTKRFTDELLPMFSGRASDLVIELLIADDACKAATAKVVENVEKPVTQNQSKENKNEFVTLGNKSKELGIRPHVLRPSCDDYNAIAGAGADGLVMMLPLIATLTDDLVKRILERNTSASDKVVIAYGGAMHNDVAPREGRTEWSYAASLRQATGDRYLEIDIFVPELIRDTDSWRAFPWYAHYDRAAHGAKVAVFRTGERSFALIFPASQ